MSRLTVEELLVGAGVLSKDQLDFARKEQRRSGVRLSRILIDHHFVQESTYYDYLSQATGIERLNLQTVEIDPQAASFVTATWALNHNMLPLSINANARLLQTAQTDPDAIKGADELAFRSSMKLIPIIASETELSRLVRSYFYGEPLDRRHSEARGPVAISDDLIVHGIASLREEVQTQSLRPAPAPPPSSTLPALNPHLAPPSSSDLPSLPRAMVEELKRLFESQQESAIALRRIFELCVARGVITKEEYVERLKRMS